MSIQSILSYPLSFNVPAPKLLLDGYNCHLQRTDFIHGYLTHLPGTYAYIFDHGINLSNGLFLDKNNRFYSFLHLTANIDSFSTSLDHLSAFCIHNNITQIRNAYISCDYLRSLPSYPPSQVIINLNRRNAANYFHFLFDMIMTLWPFCSDYNKFLDPRRTYHILMPNCRRKFHKEILDIISLPNCFKFKFSIAKNEFIAPLQLLAVPPGGYEHHIHPSICTVSKKLFSSQSLALNQKTPSTIIVIDRKDDDCTTGRFCSELSLLADLIDYNFPRFRVLKISPEELRVVDQIQLFNDAVAVVAVHGASLANIIFMQPSALVIEIHPYRFLPVYYELSIVYNLFYKYVIPERTGFRGFTPLESSLGEWPNYIELGEEVLNAILEELIFHTSSF